MEVHGIRPDQDRIKNADGIVDVWPRFINFVESHLDNGAKRGIIAAWGGESCDIEWLFPITYVKYHNTLFLPKWCPYFMDPCYVIKHYERCRLNDKHRPPSQQGNACDVVWCFLNNKMELEGVHSSLVDARAQAEIVADKRFLAYIDRPESMKGMEDVWARKRKNCDNRAAELHRPVPEGWIESENESWEICGTKRYEGSAGGGSYGPTSEVVRAATLLVTLFLFFFPMSLLEIIARETNRYGNEDWVRGIISGGYKSADGSSGRSDDDDDDWDDNDSIEADSSDDSDYNDCAKVRNRTIFVLCDSSQRDARHLCKGQWINVTPGFILVFLGVLMYRGATKV
jgi:hypothetical protein